MRIWVSSEALDDVDAVWKVVDGGEDGVWVGARDEEVEGFENV